MLHFVLAFTCFFPQDAYESWLANPTVDVRDKKIAHKVYRFDFYQMAWSIVDSLAPKHRLRRVASDGKLAMDAGLLVAKQVLQERQHSQRCRMCASLVRSLGSARATHFAPALAPSRKTSVRASLGHEQSKKGRLLYG